MFSFKLFPSSKIDFWQFLKLQKIDFGHKIFFVKLIYSISRVSLAWTFLNLLAHCVQVYFFYTTQVFYTVQKNQYFCLNKKNFFFSGCARGVYNNCIHVTNVKAKSRQIFRSPDAKSHQLDSQLCQNNVDFRHR